MDLREFRFGIEIECFGRERGQVARALQEVVGGTVAHIGTPICYDPWRVMDSQDREWKVVADSSIRAEKMVQAEIVSPILTYADIPQLQEVVRAVKKSGCKVNNSTGIHIHVERAPFKPSAMANLMKIFFKQENLIFEALKVHPHRINNYCQRTRRSLIFDIQQDKPRSYDALANIWYQGAVHDRGIKAHPSRYQALNFHAAFNAQTIEFRCFNSTLHAGEVKAYIQFVLAMAAKAINTRSARADQRPYSPNSAKYDFRCFLLSLGLIGPEFKTARLHLLKYLSGDAAFKCPSRRAA